MLVVPCIVAACVAVATNRPALCIAFLFVAVCDYAGQQGRT